MKPLVLLPYYVHWHYSRALDSIVSITKNIIWFLWHFFSVGLLASTLFAPWQRLHEGVVHRFDLGEALSRFIINTVMRLVGVVVRLTFIGIGLGAITLAFLGGIIVFVAWLVLPLLIIFSLVFGLILLIRPL